MGGAALNEETKTTLNFTPYQAPGKPQSGGYPAAFGGTSNAPVVQEESSTGAGLKVSGPRQWGPSGYNNPGGERGGKAPEPERLDVPNQPPVTKTTASLP